MYYRPYRMGWGVQNDLDRGWRAMQDEDEMECRGTWIPAVDIRERKDAFVLMAELPGMKREDIRLTIRDGILELSGEKKAPQLQEDERYNRKEIRHGSFCRKFLLNTDIDSAKVTATFRDGVLELLLPKAEKMIPKTIEIKGE
ncbi:MAG: Hsp20/alpha crystallin family protein [candidate division KSB1 bacterium]|nr:Hsp20/alpha crystallin family protein [candidate division KSB1 bacterium]